MRFRTGVLPAVAVALLFAGAEGAPARNEPHLGYLCAAGGARGSVVRVTAGGQNLRGAVGVYVSGSGVTGTVVEVRPPFRRLNPEQSAELRRRLTARRNEILAAAGARAPRRGRGDRRAAPGGVAEKQKAAADPKKGTDAKRAELPDHPFLRRLDRMGLRDLRKVAEYFFDPSIGQQMSPQIAETAVLEMHIDPDAEPGPRELRLRTPLGLSNPLVFEVGRRPEITEEEVNDYDPMPLPSPAAGLVVNGQVLRRDVDRFSFTATKGERLVFAAKARRLVPFLADAVPGWFQATLAVVDASGREVAFADDNLFDPDPVLTFTAPADGGYVLVVRDALYRGREDFVYRITIGDAAALPPPPPWTPPPAAGPVGAGDPLPEVAEEEPNDARGRPQEIALGEIVCGRIERPGDVDVYRFAARAGEEVVAGIVARTLGSPLDSYLVLTGPDGKVIAANDDRSEDRIGVLTHRADSLLTARLPSDGNYEISVLDVERHGGPGYFYRLRVSTPRPDFTLFAVPSGLNVPASGVVPFTVRVRREDGFTGEIRLDLEGAPPGFVLSGGRIPAGIDSLGVTLSAPGALRGAPVAIRLVGEATIGGRTVRHVAVPAEEEMQAFAWWHLVPARELLVAPTRFRGRMPPMARSGADSIRIAPGKTATVRFAIPWMARLTDWQFDLLSPPDGIRLTGTAPVPGGVVLTFSAESAKVRPGDAGNLIVEVSAAAPARPAAGGDKARPRRAPPRYYLGALPAIRLVIAPRPPPK